MGPEIILRGLTKVFPTGGIAGRELFTATAQLDSVATGKIAVADVNLTIRKGDRLGIVGPNGAGKSTLLHMIAGLSSPSSGSLTVTGKVTSVMTLGVGLRDHLSGRENIYIDGELQNKSRQEINAVIEDIIEFAELGEFIDYPIRTYSTGMKARLAFSMITHIEPEILIVDEALAVGDAVFSAKATQRIQEICAKGKIVIVVAHSMQSIRSICNRCLWMENGRVRMDGSPEEVTEAYLDSVRSADEAALLEKFKKTIGTRSMRNGWEILDVALFQEDRGKRQTVLEAGEPTRIEIRAKAPVNAADSKVGVQITRLDGLLLFDEYFSVAIFRLNDQSIGLEIEMSELVLGDAIYRLDVSLENSSEVLAQNSSMFEIYTLHPPAGGKPMLLYPASVSAIPA